MRRASRSASDRATATAAASSTNWPHALLSQLGALLSHLGACGEDHGVHAGVFSAATPNAKLPMNKTTVIGNFMEMRLLYDLGNCSVLTQRKRVLRPRQLRAAGSSPGTSAFT